MTMIAAALRFGLAHWRLVLASLGFSALGFALLSARAESRHWHREADRYAALYRAEQDAHRRTIAEYRRAAELARAQDQAHAARVERDQSIVSQEVTHDYSSRLADLRARYDALRLRKPAPTPATDPRSGRAADLPEAAAGAGGAAPAAGQEGLPAGLSFDDSSLDERLICSAQAEQLDALIDWVERVGGVSTARGASGAE